MSTLLIRNSEILVTMDAKRREISDGGLFVRNGIIEAVDTTANLPKHADEIIDMTGCVVIPGLINTHHHFFQNLPGPFPLHKMQHYSTGFTRSTLFGDEWAQRKYEYQLN